MKKEVTNQIVYLLKKEFPLYLGISFGVFLFILFFQPFPLERFDFNNKLIFVAGLGAIVFLFIVIIRFAFQFLIPPLFGEENGLLLIPLLGSFLLLALTATSFVFYLRYVGRVEVSFYLVFKVVLICLAAPAILKIYFRRNEIISQNELLEREVKSLKKHIKKYEGDYLMQSIEFTSEYNDENLTLIITDIIAIKSADNYVEILYKDNDNTTKKLIRNTLKNIEQLLKPYSNFIRCHRSSIVNAIYVKKLNHVNTNFWLVLHEIDEKISVSRQYLLPVKEMIKHSREELHSP